MSWSSHRAKPRFEVPRAGDLLVHRWAGRLALVPEWVSEVCLRWKVKWNGRAFDKVWEWCRRAWTPDGGNAFKEGIFEPARGPERNSEWENSCVNGDAECHFGGVQSFPTPQA